MMSGGLWSIRKKFEEVKNSVLSTPEPQAKVEEATNDYEKWGASSTLMREVCDFTFIYDDCALVMDTIWKRLDAPSKKWRQVYKALSLVEYLLKNGSERVVSDVKGNIYKIKTLENFQFVDDKGRDEGRNVREKAKKLAKLVSDPQAIADEREIAERTRNKFNGVSSDEVGTGGRAYANTGYGAGPRFGSTYSSHRDVDDDVLKKRADEESGGEEETEVNGAARDHDRRRFNPTHSNSASPPQKSLTPPQAASSSFSSSAPRRASGSNNASSLFAAPAPSTTANTELFGGLSSDPFASSGAAAFGAPSASSGSSFGFGAQTAAAPKPDTKSGDLMGFGDPFAGSAASSANKNLNVNDLFAPTVNPMPSAPAGMSAGFGGPVAGGFGAPAPGFGGPAAGMGMGVRGPMPGGFGMPMGAAPGMPMAMGGMPMGAAPGMPMAMGGMPMGAAPGMPMAMGGMPMPMGMGMNPAVGVAGGFGMMQPQLSASAARPAAGIGSSSGSAADPFGDFQSSTSRAGTSKKAVSGDVDSLVNLDPLSLSGKKDAALLSGPSTAQQQRVSMNSMSQQKVGVVQPQVARGMQATQPASNASRSNDPFAF